MSEHLDERAIARHRRGLVSDEERARIDLHIDQCAQCFRAVAEAMRTASIDGSGGLTSPMGTPFLPPGTLVTERYVILDILGAGNMGVVYLAHDATLSRHVALKALHWRREEDDRSTHERFIREGRALAAIAHPNVVTVYDVFVHDGSPYLAMEYIDGMTVTQWAEETRPNARKIVHLFLAAAQGIQAAHAQGVLHRDIKPDNILVGRDGRARVADFGLARQAVNETDTPHYLVGTHAFMAPEVLAGQRADVRSDLYAWCASLVRVLDRRFRDGPSRRRQSSSAESSATSIPWQTRWNVRKVLVKGLSRDPAKRYPSMQALIRSVRLTFVWRTVWQFSLTCLIIIGLYLWGDHREAQALDACADREVEMHLSPPSQGQVGSTQFPDHTHPVVAAWAERWREDARELCAGERVADGEERRLKALRLCLHQEAVSFGDELAVLAEARARGVDAATIEMLIRHTSAAANEFQCRDEDELRLFLSASADEEDLRLAYLARWIQHTGLAESRKRLARHRAELEGSRSRLVQYELSMIEGQLAENDGHFERALELYYTGLWRAQALGARRREARAWLALAQVRLNGLGQAREAERAEASAMAVGALRPGLGIDLKAVEVRVDRLMAQRDFEQVLRVVDEVLALREPRTAARLARLWNQGGLALLALGRPEEAEVYFDEALLLRLELEGAHDTRTAGTLANLGLAKRAQGDLWLAEEVLEVSWAIRASTLGDSHFEVARVQAARAELEAAFGRGDIGRVWMAEALDVMRAAVGPAHAETRELEARKTLLDTATP